MIDIHTHVWEDSHWSEDAKQGYRAAYGDDSLRSAPPDLHWREVASKVDSLVKSLCKPN